MPTSYASLLQYCEAGLVSEALVAVVSGVLLWIGAWDLLEIVLPPGALPRLVLIGVGLIGLFKTRTMYDESMLATVRGSRSERADTAMLSSMEMAVDDGNSKAPDSANSNGGGASTATAASDQSAAPRRAFFDPPRLDGRRCYSAVFVIMMGLFVWVGVWDLFDYQLIPLLLDAAANGSSSLCTHAEANPGPAQLWRAPGCILLKVCLLVVGVAGLWVTRSLYGTLRVHTPLYSRIG